MGVMDFLAKAGLVNATSTPDEIKPPTSQAAPAPPPAAPAAAPRATAVDPGKVAAIDDAVQKELAAAVEAAGAHCVAELGDTLTTLADVLEDEGKRYKTAVTLLAKKGVTVTDLIGGFDACIGALEQKQREFEAALGDTYQRKIGSKDAAIEKLNTTIGMKQAQIAALQDEVAKAQSQINLEKLDIAEEQAKLDLKRARFLAAYQSYRAAVEDQKSKIAKHGGA